MIKEFEWNKEQWEIEEGMVMPGEFPTTFFHDDLGRLHILQNSTPNDENSKGVSVRLSLRQCMLMGEYMAVHINQLDNLQSH